MKMSGFSKIEMSASGAGMEELWTMSTKELDRAAVMARLVEGSLTQRAAAEALAVSVRQVRRLLRGYEAQGAGALASKRRGRPSNRRLPTSLRDDALALVRERYADFGPTLACEKLSSWCRGPRPRLFVAGLRRRRDQCVDGAALRT